MKNLKLIWLFAAVIVLVSCSAQYVSSDIPAISIASRNSSLATDVNSSPRIESTLEVVWTPETTIETAQNNQEVDSDFCSALPDNQIELVVLDRINAERRNSGVPELTVQAQLTETARRHSISMGCNNFFEHSGSVGEGVEFRVQQSGYDFKALGEVIAAGYETPDEVVEEWLSSNPHREIILGEIFSEIGIGYVMLPDSKYLYYWTIVLGQPE